MISLLYQYASLRGNSSFFHSTKGVVIIFLITLIFPLPALTLYYFSRRDRVSFLEGIKSKYPSVYEFVNSAAPCDGIHFSNATVVYLLDVMFQICLVYALFLFVGLKIQRKWSQLRHTMSTNTLRIRRQYLIALYWQMSIPFMFIVVPAVGLLIAVMLKVRSITGTPSFRN